MSNSKIVFFVTGSIAAFKAAQVVSKLVQEGHQVRCVLSASAQRFVGTATFEGLTGQPVLTDLWESGRAMDHIQLSRWADFGVICPASANTLAKFSLGLADDAVSSTLLAWPLNKKLFVFPAMNTAMLMAPPTQKHLQALRERGVVVAESGRGALACGETGDGRLLEPEEILKFIYGSEVRPNTIFADESATTGSARAELTSRAPMKRLLITSGATRESIDGIRFITNHSTGRTGAELAEAFQKSGWQVTYMHGQGALRAAVDKSVEFSNYQDLCEKLKSELGGNEYDAVIQCAAVSDYTVDEVSHSDSLGNLNPAHLANKKLPSGQDLILHLSPTAKILPGLREFSRNKSIRVIGFKLTLNSSPEDMRAAAEKILDPGVDAIVANDWRQIQSARQIGRPDVHPGTVVTRSGTRNFANVKELTEVIYDLMS